MKTKDCKSCRWFFPDIGKKNPRCQQDTCKYESRAEHGAKLLAQVTDLLDHPCGICLNSILCYKGGEKEIKCSKVKSKEEKEKHIQYCREKEKNNNLDNSLDKGETK